MMNQQMNMEIDVEEIMDIMDGREARQNWYDNQLAMRQMGEDYDLSIEDEVWVRGYIKGMWD